MRLIKAFQASSIEYVAAAIFIRYNISSAATRGGALTEVAVATYLFDDGLHKKEKEAMQNAELLKVCSSSNPGGSASCPRWHKLLHWGRRWNYPNPVGNT
jgi:hypothetical protein